MNLPVKIRRDWHYYAFAIGLIFILNGVVGLLGFEDGKVAGRNRIWW